MRDDSPVVFPQDIVTNKVDRTMRIGGLRLRDWFAGQALAGLMAGMERPDDNLIAKTAYELADAMLAARGRE